jgi:hypothetical protein
MEPNKITTGLLAADELLSGISLKADKPITDRSSPARKSPVYSCAAVRATAMNLSAPYE